MNYEKPVLFAFGSGASPDCMTGTGASYATACTVGPTNDNGTGVCETGLDVATSYGGCHTGNADALSCFPGSSAPTYCDVGGIDTNHTGCQTGFSPI
jgi:hypothetical protein